MDEGAATGGTADPLALPQLASLGGQRSEAACEVAMAGCSVAADPLLTKYLTAIAEEEGGSSDGKDDSSDEEELDRQVQLDGHAGTNGVLHLSFLGFPLCPNPPN
jgi:hypothetical protein